jgi:predicted ATP-binding protein involved in virulence
MRHPFTLTPDEETDLKKRDALIPTSALQVSDEVVIQRMIELDYRAYRLSEPLIRSIIPKIASTASEITNGFPIEFLKVEEDKQGLFPQFRTPDGDLPLNTLSQGTQSIIQWLAHLLIGYAEYYDHPPDLEERPGILIIDEIDAHLHPSWQRRIIPTLTKHFPNLQIFCSTHSPLMLAGLKAGQVQLLKRDTNGKVTVSRNEVDIRGWSADEVLRGFLDVPNPTDLETARHIERLGELRRKEKLSEEEAVELEQLRYAVNQDLVEGPIAAEIERFADLLKQARAESAAQREAGSSTEGRPTRRRRKPASTPQQTSE